MLMARQICLKNKSENFQLVMEVLAVRSFRLEEANEQLIAHDKMQKEFINIQPILSLTELLRSQIKDVKQQEILDITIRNAKRLQRFSNDILKKLKEDF
jgi:hypothetical protein